MSYLVFDLLIGAVLLIALARGYSRGFVLTLCGFLAVFVAFIGASVLSNARAGGQGHRAHGGQPDPRHRHQLP